MLIFRYTHKEELANILGGNYADVGHSFSRTSCNTFNYNSRDSYLHFFKNISSIDKYKRDCRSHNEMAFDDKESYFILILDIPILTLMKFSGAGFYDTSGYITDYDVAKEYAIPVSKFKHTWPVGYLDKDNNLTLLEHATAKHKRAIEKELAAPELFDEQ